MLPALSQINEDYNFIKRIFDEMKTVDKIMEAMECWQLTIRINNVAADEYIANYKRNSYYKAWDAIKSIEIEKYGCLKHISRYRNDTGNWENLIYYDICSIDEDESIFIRNASDEDFNHYYHAYMERHPQQWIKAETNGFVKTIEKISRTNTDCDDVYFGLNFLDRYITASIHPPEKQLVLTVIGNRVGEPNWKITLANYLNSYNVKETIRAILLNIYYSANGEVLTVASGPVSNM